MSSCLRPLLDKFYKISRAYSFIVWLEQKQLVHSLFSSWKLHKLCYEIRREPHQAHLTTQSSSFIRDAQSAETSTETSRRPSSAANNADKTITAAAVVALVWIARRRSALLCFNKLGSVQCVWLCCALFCLHAVNSWTFLCGARPARLCSTTASPNCCGLSAHQPASVLKKRLCL